MLINHLFLQQNMAKTLLVVANAHVCLSTGQRILNSRVAPVAHMSQTLASEVDASARGFDAVTRVELSTDVCERVLALSVGLGSQRRGLRRRHPGGARRGGRAGDGAGRGVDREAGGQARGGPGGDGGACLGG